MEELVGVMMSSLKDHLRWKGGQPPRGLEESKLAAAWPSQSKTPRRRRRDISTKRDLTEMREAHQRALTVTRGWLGAHTQSQSCDCQRRSPRGRIGGTAGFCWKTALSILLIIALPGGPRSLGRQRG